MPTTFPIDVTVDRLIEFHGLADALCLQELGRLPSHTAGDPVAEIIELQALQGQTGAQIQAWLHQQPEAVAHRAIPPFQPAPRYWKGQMCGIRVPGVSPVLGGAGDPALILSWFYDRYIAVHQTMIRAAWHARGDTHVLLSWPDSRAIGQTPQQFLTTCRALIADGFYPCVMLCSKDYDPPDVIGTLSNIAPVLSLLVGVVPMFCVGWELSLWLSPFDVQSLIAALSFQWLKQPGTLGYVHFQEGYFAYQLPGLTTADFWKANVGQLHGVLHQRDLAWDQPMYQARITDCLQRFAGGFNFPTDSGFGHPFDFVALEITAQPQFNGQMNETDGDRWGDVAITTPPVGEVRVMGSGNGASQ